MALFNYTTKEITVKVVYYGPGLSGKTTNLQYLHHILNPNKKGKLVSLPTEADRTLFFDLLPVDLGKIRDFSLRFQLYTVPGQVRYNATRKLVLKGSDAVVFVADSQREMREQNVDSFKNMRENLVANNINPDEIPILLQYNKRDLPNILSIDELSNDLNENGKYKYVEAIAIDGEGVEEAFQNITKVAVEEIKKKVDLSPSEDVAKDREIRESRIEVGISEPQDQELATTSPIIETTMYESEAIKDKEEELPMEVDVTESMVEEPVIANPITEPTMYDPFDIEYNKYLIPDLKEEPDLAGIEKGSTFFEEAAIKETVEVPPILLEKLDMIIKNINEVLHTLKDMNRVIKDTTEEHRGINAQLRDLRKNFEKLKTKKRWFRFL